MGGAAVGTEGLKEEQLESGKPDGTTEDEQREKGDGEANACRSSLHREGEDKKSEIRQESRNGDGHREDLRPLRREHRSTRVLRPTSRHGGSGERLER